MKDKMTEYSFSYPVKNCFYLFLGCFSLLFMLSFPFDSQNLPVPGKWIEPFFSSLVDISAQHVFQTEETISLSLLSDTKALYIHTFNLLVISFFVAFLIQWYRANKELSPVFVYSFTVVISYYLAYHLLSYGFNKVFKYQFFLPEPNTLYTTVGQTPKDLLYWTSMGSSWLYNVFTGSLEVIAGILLLFRKTRLPGGLFSFAVMLNVVMINFSFDISVKIFSSFLLLLSVIIISPHIKRLYFFVVQEKVINITMYSPVFSSLVQRRTYLTIKLFVLAIIFYNALAIYFISGNFNDDLAKRPLFHGAYDVKENASGWKRVFIHRRGYFIIQTQDERMYDFKLEYDTTGKKLILEKYITKNKYEYPYSQNGENILILTKLTDSSQIILEKLDLTRLPLLKNEFHWTID
ncbi:MAG: hypothetical protein ACOZCO_14920 [Bacteroidota bacterium]